MGWCHDGRAQRFGSVFLWHAQAIPSRSAAVPYS